MLRRAAAGLAGFLVVVALLLGVVHTAAWFWAERRLEQGLAERLDSLRAEGWVIEAGLPVRSGWPVAAALDLAAVSASHPALAGGMAWRAGQVRLEVTFLHPGTVLILPSGVQSVRLGGLPPVEYSATGVRAAVQLDTPDRLRFQATTVHVAAPFDVSLQHLAGVLAPDSVSLSVGGLVLPDSVPWALGRQVADVSIDAGLPNPALPDSRGKLLLRHLALQWGPLSVQGSGIASLDAARHPVLGGTMRVHGAAETLATLRTAGILNPNQAVAAGAMLGLLLRGAGPDGVIELPVSVQDGLLNLGKVPRCKAAALGLAAGLTHGIPAASPWGRP